jgi:hypothetical protein
LSKYFEGGTKYAIGRSGPVWLMALLERKGHRTSGFPASDEGTRTGSRVFLGVRGQLVEVGYGIEM